MIFTDISGVENFLRNISADSLSNTFYYLMIGVFWFFPKNGGIHFYHNVQAFNVDSRSTLKA